MLALKRSRRRASMQHESNRVRHKPQLYFAAPLFSIAEKRFNVEVTHALESYFQVYLPQRDGGLMVEMISRGLSPSVAANHVFQADVRAIVSCDVLVAT